MESIKLEKWQEVLNGWKTWKESIDSVRITIEHKYGDVAEATRGAKVDLVVQNEGSANESFDLLTNEKMWLRWEIDGELEDIASDFVSREMGLCRYSDLHNLFRDNWVNSALGALILASGLLSRMPSPRHQLNKADNAR